MHRTVGNKGKETVDASLPSHWYPAFLLAGPPAVLPFIPMGVQVISVTAKLGEFRVHRGMDSRTCCYAKATIGCKFTWESVLLNLLTILL